jgi:hypothetical protein
MLNIAKALMQSSENNMPPPLQMPGVPVAPTDTIGPEMAKWQAEMENAQRAEQAKAQLMGSIFGLAGSALGGWGMGGFKKFW